MVGERLNLTVHIQQVLPDVPIVSVAKARLASEILKVYLPSLSVRVLLVSVFVRTELIAVVK
jgi:hypothetical protein